MYSAWLGLPFVAAAVVVAQCEPAGNGLNGKPSQVQTICPSNSHALQSFASLSSNTEKAADIVAKIVNGPFGQEHDFGTLMVSTRYGEGEPCGRQGGHRLRDIPPWLMLLTQCFCQLARRLACETFGSLSQHACLTQASPVIGPPPMHRGASLVQGKPVGHGRSARGQDSHEPRRPLQRPPRRKPGVSASEAGCSRGGTRVGL